MVPHLASLLTFGFIVFLFRRDNRQKSAVTGAVWIPLLWLLAIIGKNVADWVWILTGMDLNGAISVDSVVWTVLIVAGLRILWRRQVDCSKVVHLNRCLTAYLIYAFMSVHWSDFPLWSLKHLIAVIGHPIMALIILTEPDPEAALKRVMKRCAYVVIPVSILLIRYYPQYGIVYSGWTGQLQKAGFAVDKNSLGVICMICGFFFVWHLLNTLRRPKNKSRRNEVLLCVGFLLMIAYLFNGLHCGTALVSFAAGVTTVMIIGLPSVNKQHLGRYFLTGIVIVVVANEVFGLKAALLDLLEKDPTLTSRTVMWDQLLQSKINPVLGTGYDSYWQEDQTKELIDKYYGPTDARPNEAHNGYLETYLNLGLAGLLLLIAWLLATFHKCQSELLRNYQLGLFRLGVFVALVLYNWTEAGFKTITPVFFMLFLITVDYPKPQMASQSQDIDASVGEEPTELVSAKETPRFSLLAGCSKMSQC